MHGSRVALCTVLLLSPPPAVSQGTSVWPTLAEQLAQDHVPPGSSLEAFITANQEVELIPPEEHPGDQIGLPLWMRVNFHKTHANQVFTKGDPSGGYPRFLMDVWGMAVRNPYGCGSEFKSKTLDEPTALALLKKSGLPVKRTIEWYFDLAGRDVWGPEFEFRRALEAVGVLRLKSFENTGNGLTYEFEMVDPVAPYMAAYCSVDKLTGIVQEGDEAWVTVETSTVLTNLYQKVIPIVHQFQKRYADFRFIFPTCSLSVPDYQPPWRAWTDVEPSKGIEKVHFKRCDEGWRVEN